MATKTIFETTVYCSHYEHYRTSSLGNPQHIVIFNRIFSGAISIGCPIIAFTKINSQYAYCMSKYIGEFVDLKYHYNVHGDHIIDSMEVNKEYSVLYIEPCL